MITTYECREKELFNKLTELSCTLSTKELSRLLGCTLSRAFLLSKGKVSMRLNEALVLGRKFNIRLMDYVTVRKHEFNEIFGN